jgi:hypothetical protein
MSAAAAVAAPSVYSGGSSVIALGVLLAEFGMFRQALLRDQVRLYAVQSGLISVLAILVAAVRAGRSAAARARAQASPLTMASAMRLAATADDSSLMASTYGHLPR